MNPDSTTAQEDLHGEVTEDGQSGKDGAEKAATKKAATKKVSAAKAPPAQAHACA